MNVPSKPTFDFQELQQAVDAARPIVENVDEARDRVSNDIKNLEAYLKGLGLEVAFRYSLGKALVEPEDDNGAQQYSIEEYGGASGQIEEESLAWDLDKTGKFRLLYELDRWDGCVNYDAYPAGPYFWDEKTLVREVKPLIETGFETRKRMYKHLPEFVRKFAKSMCADPNQDHLLGDDEIPF